MRMNRRRGEDGAVTALVAALLMSGLLFGLAALVVDLGLARDQVQSSQISSDAAALGAANALYPVNGADCVDTSAQVKAPCLRDAVKRAEDLSGTNFGISNLDGCAVPGQFFTSTNTTAPGPDSCVSFWPSVAAPTKVSVLMPEKDVPARFTAGNVSSVQSVPVNTSAQAAVVPYTSVTCGLCFLGSISTTKFNASVTPGSLAVNGSVTMSGNGSLWAATTIAYTGTFDSNDKIDDSGTLTKVSTFSDPWASKAGVPPAVPVGYPVRAPGDDPCTAGPGIYGAFEFKHACTFSAGGLYVVTGPWTWKNITVTAPGVTIYVTPSGWVDTKNGDLVLTAPTSGALAGLAIIYDRSNTNPLLLQGNGESSITGAIYAPASTWDYNGTSDVNVVGGPVILKSMTGNGDTGVRVTASNDAEALKLPGDAWLDN